MKTKELEIVAPEGYEIDKENSTFERIVFKKKDDKPRSWEEFCKRGYTGEEGYVTSIGAVKSCGKKGAHRDTTAVGYVDNIEEAEAFLALMQLRQLRKAWVGDWEPDWLLSELKHVIDVSNDCIRVSAYCHDGRCLSFPTEDMAFDFIACFKDLLEQAKILL